MKLADIPQGASCFVDANILLYALTEHATYGAACAGFLKRIENQEIFAVTSTYVLGEVVHRLMTIEACDRFGWPQQGIANRLRRHRVRSWLGLLAVVLVAFQRRIANVRIGHRLVDKGIRLAWIKIVDPSRKELAQNASRRVANFYRLSERVQFATRIGIQDDLRHEGSSLDLSYQTIEKLGGTVGSRI